MGIVTVFDNPARQTFYVELVGADNLRNAVTLYSSLVNLARIIGPAFAAALIAAVGAIGLAGTLSINVLERRREIGVMRAIGAYDRIVIKLVILEGLIIGLISFVMASLTSFPITFLLANVITRPPQRDDVAGAAAADRLYPQLLPSEGTCTIGGNLATNAGGTAAIAHGIARSHALGLEVVLADGRVLHNLNKLKKDNTGYDLKNLFIGSEGTLGVITKVLLKLIPKPAAKTTMVATFAQMDQAAEAVSAIIAAQIIPCTLEFLDRTTIHCVEDYAKIGKLNFEVKHTSEYIVELIKQKKLERLVPERAAARLADALLRSQRMKERAESAVFQAGETDRLAWLSARYETVTAELARLNALSQAQQTLGRLEDALHRPISGDPLPATAEQAVLSKQVRYEEHP